MLIYPLFFKRSKLNSRLYEVPKCFENLHGFLDIVYENLY